jgi:hypothetical protein
MMRAHIANESAEISRPHIAGHLPERILFVPELDVMMNVNVSLESLLCEGECLTQPNLLEL